MGQEREGDEAEIPQISPAEVKTAVEQGQPKVILDVREESEWIRGHIPGAVWIPLGELTERIGELPADREIVAVCRSGNRSGVATQFLNLKGHTTRNMVGGMKAWNGEVRTGPG